MGVGSRAGGKYETEEHGRGRKKELQGKMRRELWWNGREGGDGTGRRQSRTRGLNRKT